MSKALETKLQKAGEEIAASVVDAAVDITVAAMKDASALGKEIVKDAIEDAKEIVEKKMEELCDSITDTSATHLGSTSFAAKHPAPRAWTAPRCRQSFARRRGWSCPGPRLA